MQAVHNDYPAREKVKDTLFWLAVGAVMFICSNLPILADSAQ